jgi:hypothetical protein
MFDPTTGEITERSLDHENGYVERSYGTLSSPARVGIEATVSAPWFESILTRFQHELWVEDAAEIRTARVRKQKTDSRDAQHILDLPFTNCLHESGCPRPPSGAFANCCDIATSWCAIERR